MPVDNLLYEREARTWWQEGSFLSIIRIAINPARLTYLDHIATEMGWNAPARSALDVGSGGGYLTVELASRGFTTAGIDPSAESIAVAKAHAQEKGLLIDYRVANAESLPFPSASFDLITCCDVLEHLDDLDLALSEITRVLKPGGVFLYDTINRTFMTWLGVIFTAQEFPLTRFFPPRTHDWHMFIRPDELVAALDRHGISNRELRGLSAAINPVAQFGLILQLKYGGMDYREYGRRTQLYISNDTCMNYIGFGIKA
jgi:2-polyprenyl-6-hydroxyphenyl methylase / 3-demethylubiquinone-9 3-methyltransferase